MSKQSKEIKECNFKVTHRFRVGDEINLCGLRTEIHSSRLSDRCSENYCSGEDNCILYQMYKRLMKMRGDHEEPFTPPITIPNLPDWYEGVPKWEAKEGKDFFIVSKSPLVVKLSKELQKKTKNFLSSWEK